MSLQSTDRKVALVLIILSLLYLFLSYQLPDFAYAIVDADVLPKGLGYLLLFLALILFFQNKPETKDQKARWDNVRSEIKILLLTVAALFLYTLLLEPIGFVISTIAFLIITARIFGYTKWRANVIVSVLFTLALYFSFNYLLLIYLPQGILPF